MLTVALIIAMLTEVLTVGLVAVLLLAVLAGVAGCSPEQRMIRERRRHAERTARAMRRMTRVRENTIARMDRAERRRKA
jgi:hypothetical protein